LVFRLTWTAVIEDMKNTRGNETVKGNSARELRAELARKIASFIGKEENRITEIPGVSLHRRSSPTPPCQTTYHPGIIVVAQGSKQVNLGSTSFIYDESHFLLTAVDLPIVSWVAKATEEFPCLVLSLKLDMSMVRELLSHEEIHVAEAPSDSPAMSIGKTTPEFLNACCRLLDLLESPKDIPFLSDLIQRVIIYRVLRGSVGARLRAVATLGDQSHRTAKAVAWIAANHAKPLRVDFHLVPFGNLRHFCKLQTRNKVMRHKEQVGLFQRRRNPLQDRCKYPVPYRDRKFFLFHALAFFRSLPGHVLRRWTIAVMNAVSGVSANLNRLPSPSAVHDNGIGHLFAGSLRRIRLRCLIRQLRPFHIEFYIAIASEWCSLAVVPSGRNLYQFRLLLQGFRDMSVQLCTEALRVGTLCGIWANSKSFLLARSRRTDRVSQQATQRTTSTGMSGRIPISSEESL
jgi:hypothetical protein